MYRQHTLLLTFPFLFTLAVIYLLYSGGKSGDSVNVVLGNKSYLHVFGELPDENVPDQLRIKTHLEYVEGILRNRSVDHLSEKQKKNRIRHLGNLREYIRAGKFPYNDGHPDQRRPTFISDNGNICAVGYLAEQDLGREAVEMINEQFKYEYITEIDHPVFKEWTESSGFTIRELAMIQPKYDTIITEEVERNSYRVGLSYGIGSSLLASANALYLSNNAVNPWLFDRSSSSHWFGLAAGSGSVLLGALNLNNSYSYLEPLHHDGYSGLNHPKRKVTVTSRPRTALSIANIGVGCISLLRSGYHLIRGTKENPSETLFGVTRLEANPLQSSGEPVPAVQLLVRF